MVIKLYRSAWSVLYMGQKRNPTLSFQHNFYLFFNLHLLLVHVTYFTITELSMFNDIETELVTGSNSVLEKVLFILTSVVLILPLHN